MHLQLSVCIVQDGELWLCGSECGIFDSYSLFFMHRRPGIGDGRLKNSIVDGYQPPRILLSMFLFFLFLARERRRNGERPKTSCFKVHGAPMFKFCTMLPGCIWALATQSSKYLQYFVIIKLLICNTW